MKDPFEMSAEERRKMVESRKRLYENQRVEFVSLGEPDPDPLIPGERGLCTHVDDIGTLTVEWDSGRRLGITLVDVVSVVRNNG